MQHTVYDTFLSFFLNSWLNNSSPFSLPYPFFSYVRFITNWLLLDLMDYSFKAKDKKQKEKIKEKKETEQN